MDLMALFPPVLMIGFSKNGVKCFATPIGPIPGPPPPWGMAKVLCKFNDTSAPIKPGG